MNLHSIAVAVSIALGGPVTVDIYPTFTMPLEVPFVGVLPADIAAAGGKPQVDAIALPHLVLYHPRLTPGEMREVMAHERVHMLHWEAFGPAFVGMYAITGGVPFEDYRGSEMYVPPVGLRQCPMLRVSSETGVSLMPCWRY